MNLSRIYDLSLRLLIIFLPFSTFLSIFFREKLGIPGISFLKEGLIFLMLSIICIEHIRGQLRIIWTRYDILMGLYICVLCIITFFTTGITGLIYGGRYDFAFLVAFFAAFHGLVFLSKPVSYYIRLFLISGGIALFLSMLLKWPFSEDILLYFGYSGNPSNWQFGSSVPIFHGVEGANVRRFQGLFDGPNTMGAFLLMYIGVFVYYFRQYKAWYFSMGVIVFGLITCIIYTYSRSALLGLFGGFGFVILFSLKDLYRHYRAQMIALFLIGCLGIGAVLLQYGGNIRAIIERGGSSEGHAERMITGFHQFIEHPLGQGLGSVGPAYRYVENLEGKDRSEIEKLDVYNIPESWYIQQFEEGGIFGGALFLLLMGYILYSLSRVHLILGGMFFSILIMNFFLHTFESSMLSLTLFILIGVSLGKKMRTYEK